LIGRGRYKDLYLYEITAQDLLLPEGASNTYRVGNVLIYPDKRHVGLGRELACADDIFAAKEFLDDRGFQGVEHTADNEAEAQDDAPAIETQAESAVESSTAYSTALAEAARLQEEIHHRDENLLDLNVKIEQRDELLRDLSESLKTQKEDNELLRAVLENTRERVKLDALSREELIDDLEKVSGTTENLGAELERALEEKFTLEQELAERITELLELSLQNEELKSEALGLEADRILQQSEPEHDSTGRERSPAPLVLGTFSDENQIVTMASGKQIHIYHEFPRAPKRSLPTRLRLVVGSALRALVIVVFASLVLLAASVFATSRVNDISYGDSLDLFLESF